MGVTPQHGKARACGCVKRRDQAIREASEAYAAQKAALEDRLAANAEQAGELEAQQLACKQVSAYCTLLACAGSA